MDSRYNIDGFARRNSSIQDDGRSVPPVIENIEEVIEISDDDDDGEEIPPTIDNRRSPSNFENWDLNLLKVKREILLQELKNQEEISIESEHFVLPSPGSKSPGGQSIECASSGFGSSGNQSPLDRNLSPISEDEDIQMDISLTGRHHQSANNPNVPSVRNVPITNDGDIHTNGSLSGRHNERVKSPSEQRTITSAMIGSQDRKSFFQYDEPADESNQDQKTDQKYSMQEEKNFALNSFSTKQSIQIIDSVQLAQSNIDRIESSHYNNNSDQDESDGSYVSDGHKFNGTLNGNPFDFNPAATPLYGVAGDINYERLMEMVLPKVVEIVKEDVVLVRKKDYENMQDLLKDKVNKKRRSREKCDGEKKLKTCHGNRTSTVTSGSYDELVNAKKSSLGNTSRRSDEENEQPMNEKEHIQKLGKFSKYKRIKIYHKI